MKSLSLSRFFALGCAAALLSACQSGDLAPQRAVKRLTQSPTVTVFSHNDMNSPRFRDCYEAGPLPERAQRALTEWLRNSTVKEMSYVYPQYFITTLNARGGNEVAWALCSDGQGNLVGVLVPDNKRVPAWDLPTIGSYRVLVCDTPEKKALGDAIMESIADAGYDKVRIDTRKAAGITDKRYLVSKPLNEAEEALLKAEKEARDKAAKEAAERKAQAAENALRETASDSEVSEDDSSSDDSGDDASTEDSGDSDSSDDSGDDSSSDEDSGDLDLNEDL